MRMPDLVVQALALALRYLKQFHLERVLRLGAVFRPFSGRTEMNLSPNALRQLEVLTAFVRFFYDLAVTLYIFDGGHTFIKVYGFTDNDRLISTECA
jgi:hypothetical protein